MKEQSNDGMTIDLVNLLGHILIKWKVILIVALIAGVLAGILSKATGLAGDGSSQEEVADEIVEEQAEEPVEEPATPPDMEMLIEQAASVLTEEQKAEADEIYSDILEYERTIKEQKYFNDNCYTMSLDPEKAVGYYMRYLLETDLGNAGNYYNGYIVSEDDYKEISDLLGPDIGKIGLNEAVSISVNTADPDPSYKLDLERTDRLSGEVENKYKLIVTAYIYAPNAEVGESIAKVVDKAVTRKTDILKKQGSTVKCTLIDSGLDASVKLSVINRKRDKVNAVVALVNGEPAYLNNLITGVTNASELEYINRLRGIMPVEVKEDDKEAKAKAEAEAKAKAEAEAEAAAAPEPTKKSAFFYVVIAFAGGAFLSICWFAFSYIICGRLHSERELSNGAGIPVLQTLSTDIPERSVSKTDIIVRCGRKLSGADVDTKDSPEKLAEELVNIARKRDIRQIYIATDLSSAPADDIAKKIADMVSGDITLTVGGLEPGADELKQLLTSDGVIVLPFFDITKTQIIRSFLGMCKRNDKYVIGYAPVWDQKAL